MIGFGLIEATTTNLRYRRLNEDRFDTIDLIYYYLTPWLTKEKIYRWTNKTVFDDEIGIIASDIDKLYAYIGSTWLGERKRKWVLVEIPTIDLLSYGIKHWGFETPETKQDRDESAVKAYTVKMRKTHPPPIILGSGPTSKPELLDGMHRIYAANAAGVRVLHAFIPEDGLKWLKEK